VMRDAPPSAPRQVSSRPNSGKSIRWQMSVLCWRKMGRRTRKNTAPPESFRCQPHSVSHSPSCPEHRPSALKFKLAYTHNLTHTLSHTRGVQRAFKKKFGYSSRNSMDRKALIERLLLELGDYIP
jgi:hypothetical protein